MGPPLPLYRRMSFYLSFSLSLLSLFIAYNRYWFTSVLVIRFFFFSNTDGRVAITSTPFGHDYTRTILNTVSWRPDRFCPGIKLKRLKNKVFFFYGIVLKRISFNLVGFNFEVVMLRPPTS